MTMIDYNDCEKPLPEDAVEVESIGATFDQDGKLYPCPGDGCASYVEWYADCTATWCMRCLWSGWGYELRYGLPGSHTGIL